MGDITIPRKNAGRHATATLWIFFAAFLSILSSCSQEQARESLRSSAASDPCSGNQNEGNASFSKSDCFRRNDLIKPDEEEDVDGADGTPTTSDLLLPLKDDQVAALLKEECAACHGEKTGEYASFWGIDPEQFNAFTLRTDPLAPTVYYALYNRSINLTVKKPPAMPPAALDEKRAKKFQQLLRWFQVELPLVVQTAVHRYGGKLEDHNVTGDFKIRYKCNDLVSARNFLVRVTQDLYERNPTQQEFTTLLKQDVNKPATAEIRARIAKELFTNPDRMAEFEETALKKFAQKIAGSHEILEIPGQLTSDQTTDLKSEFYQYLKKYYRTRSWKDILLQKTVMVTANTAPLYQGCTAPTEAWGECTLKSPRSSFFSTAGFLASKATSFLVANNNYGRVAQMHFTISGSLFKPATDGPTGEATNPLPSCLKSTDWRGTVAGENFAPYGTMAIPATGNVCQSCHIGRQLAVGSMLFRPFMKSGRIYTAAELPEDLNAPEADADYVTAMTEINGHVVRRQLQQANEEQLNREMLLALLAGTGQQACIPGEGGQADRKLKDVADFAAYLIGDGSALGEGLGRHIPRALGNVPIATEEVIHTISKVHADQKGLLLPMIQAYLTTETYSCETKE